jgi:hypothetical protein
MNWADIVKLRKYTSITQCDINLELLDDGIYKVSATQYCISVPYCGSSLVAILDGSFLVAVLWACSEGAAKRAYLGRIEEDDGSELIPPDEILPAPNSKSYASILNSLRYCKCNTVMEYASYRIMTDGAFIHKVIESKIALYFFRKRLKADKETPYAIQWNLK